MNFNTIFDVTKGVVKMGSAIGVEMMANVGGDILYKHVKNPTVVKKIFFALGSNAIGGLVSAAVMKHIDDGFEEVRKAIENAQIVAKAKERVKEDAAKT